MSRPTRSTARRMRQMQPRQSWRLGRWLLGACALAVTGLVLWTLTIEVVLWRGSGCLEARAHERALSWFRVAERLSWERAEIHYLMARCYRRLRQFEQVPAHLQRARELGWDANQLEREQWLALAQMNQFEAIKPHWDALFEHAGSDSPEVCKAFITDAMSWFRIAEARRVLEAWEADYPNDPDSAVFRGRLQDTLYDWDGAAKAFRRALDLDPHRLDARFCLAQVLFNLREPKAAEAQVRQVLQAEPSHLEAQVLFAQVLQQLARPEEARQFLEGVLNNRPNQVEALLELGNVELGTGQARQALKHLEQAAKLRPESHPVIYAYAKALQANGQATEAAARFTFVDEAIKALTQRDKLLNQLHAEPGNLDVRFQVATLTWKYRSHEEGEKWFRSLLRLDPQHIPTHAALARHYQGAGDVQRAAYHRRLAEAATGMTKVDQAGTNP